MSRIKPRLAPKAHPPRVEKAGLQLPKLIVILGPTASGKTDLSLKLARKFDGEIISADSRQIYRGMNIGTGKVEADLRRYKRGLTQIIVGGVPHYLLDVVNPDQEFTLADYKKKAVAAIRDILKRGKTPFLVGGTGLYIQSVVDNLEIPAVAPNKKLRAQFEKELATAPSPQPSPLGERGIDSRAREKVIEKWYKKLLKIDPGAALVVDAKNPRRIIRALEVSLATGKPFSKLREKGEQLFDTLQIGITLPREKLYERIDRRVEQMIKEGLIDETKKLLKKYKPSLPSMSGIGYKEMGEYLDEIPNSKFQIPNKIQNSKSKIRKMSVEILENKVQKIKFRTHDYARRQTTWFRRDKRIKWIKNYKETEEKIGRWLR